MTIETRFKELAPISSFVACATQGKKEVGEVKFLPAINAEPYFVTSHVPSKDNWAELRISPLAEKIAAGDDAGDSHPFYSHLATKKQLVERAIQFGVSRQVALNHMMTEQKTVLMRAQKVQKVMQVLLGAMGLYTAAQIKGAQPLLALASSISFAMGQPYVTAFCLHAGAPMLSKKINLMGTALFATVPVFWLLSAHQAYIGWWFRNTQATSIDLEAFEQTRDYQGAHHYLSAARAHYYSGVLGKVRALSALVFTQQIDRRLAFLSENRTLDPSESERSKQLLAEHSDFDPFSLDVATAG